VLLARRQRYDLGCGPKVLGDQLGGLPGETEGASGRSRLVARSAERRNGNDSRRSCAGLLRMRRKREQQRERKEETRRQGHAGFAILRNFSTQSFGCRCGRPSPSRKAAVNRASVNISEPRMTRC